RSDRAGPVGEAHDARIHARQAAMRAARETRGLRVAAVAHHRQGAGDGRVAAVEERPAERPVLPALAVDAPVVGARIVVDALAARAREAREVHAAAVLVDAVAADLGRGIHLADAGPEDAVVAAHLPARSAGADPEGPERPRVAGARAADDARLEGDRT